MVRFRVSWNGLPNFFFLPSLCSVDVLNQTPLEVTWIMPGLWIPLMLSTIFNFNSDPRQPPERTCETLRNFWRTNSSRTNISTKSNLGWDIYRSTRRQEVLTFRNTVESEFLNTVVHYHILFSGGLDNSNTYYGGSTLNLGGGGGTLGRGDHGASSRDSPGLSPQRTGDRYRNYLTLRN